MSIDLEKTVVWANDETQVDTPPTELQDEGYAGEEQPFNEHHNWIWNSRDKKLNRLTDRANRTHISSPGLSIEDFCSDLNHPEDDWVHPYSSYNNYGFIPTEFPIYLCRGWNYTLKKPCIYVVIQGDNSKIVEIRNGDDFSIEREDHSVSITGTIDAICCDGPYVYILGVNLGSARVTKIQTNPWSATPVAEGGSPILIDTTNVGKNRIIVADSIRIAFVGKDEHCASAKVINVWNKTIGGNLEGRGNAPNSATDFPGTALCSDGFTLFFTTSSTTGGDTRLCAANIADPTTATGSGGAFANTSIGASGVKGGHTIFDGRHISVINDLGYVISFNKDVDRVRNLDFRFENTKSPNEAFPKFVFDGFTAWAMFQHDGDDDANNGFIAPFRPQGIMLDYPTGTMTLKKKEFLSSFTDGATVMGETRLEYSDGCLWYIKRAGDEQIIYRLPNILNRR
jgi:hypothetical protein